MMIDTGGSGDLRYAQLQHWLRDELALPVVDIAPASADASFRRYFRVVFDGVTRIVMDAPPEKEPLQPFVSISALLSGLGLHVPKVLEQNERQGFLLLTDLGSRQYLDELNDQSVQQLYEDALQALILIQSCPAHRLRQLPRYDEAMLREEMELFREWYLRRSLQMTLTGKKQQMLGDAFDLLITAALEQPQVLVHRDYHSRNLMISVPNPGILDFQDAVIGPVSYDLVSLLRDCYVAWPREQVEGWVANYHSMATKGGGMQRVNIEQLLRWFDLMGVQRHLKAVGIFSRLDRRDGKPGYLKNIPRTLRYIEDVCHRYPELHGLKNVIF